MLNMIILSCFQITDIVGYEHAEYSFYSQHEYRR